MEINPELDMLFHNLFLNVSCIISIQACLDHAKIVYIA